MLDQAFEALKTYDWGVDPKAVQPIDEAIVATHGDAGARKKLEARLAAALGTDIPRAAKDIVCRALRTVGTAACVPALAELLGDEELSHMARYALQYNPSPEATKALTGALQAVPAKLKIGIASSLGARAREAEIPVAPLAALLTDKDPAVARAGALALGVIGSTEAGRALFAAKAGDANVETAIADSLLICAENLHAAGDKAKAKAVYEKVQAAMPSETIKEAAELGIKANS